MTEHDTEPRQDRDRDDLTDNRTHATSDGGDHSRRGFLKTTGALGAAGLLGFGTDAIGQTRAVASAASSDPWTVVAIPDTQNMINVDNWHPYAHSITDWIVDNADEQNIAFVSHEGDMVWNGDEIGQWEEIDRVMSKLDGVVPWSPGVGNHDFQDTWDRSSGAENFKQYFGPSRFEGRSYYGGSSPGDRSCYQYFSAGGYDFLHISLEWEAPGDPDDPSTPLGWAQQVLDENPDLPTIITTHSYLEDDPRRRRQNVQSGSRGNSGQDIWEKLVEPNPQVFMTLNGHAHQADDGDDGEHHQVSTNTAGEDVYELLANYQDYDNGGDGWFRRIRFVPGGGVDAPDRIEVQTYTAYHDEYKTGNRSEFSFDLDFDSRFDASGDGGEETDEVSFVSVSETASTTDRFTVDRPRGVTEGDVLLLTIGGTANGDDGMPYAQADRWTRIDICSQDVNGAQECVADGQDLFLHMYYTVATGNEPAEYDVASGGNSVASVAAFRGVNTDDPVASSAALVNDGDYRVSTCPSTAGVDGGMLVCGITQDDQLYLEDHDELTRRSVDENVDSTTTVLTESLNSDGATDRYELDIVDPTGNKDISMSAVLRPSSTEDGGREEGLHVVDDTTARAVWTPDFEVEWPDYVYFGSSVNDDPREWQLMDETADNVFETTLGGLSEGDQIAYLFAYYEDGAWQYTERASEPFQPDGESGPETNKLVYGDGDALGGGEYLESSNGDYRLYFQASDGNLVIRDTSTGDAQWASGTAGDGGTRLTLQGDGNLVIYTADDDPVWASNTAGSGADELVLENDGTLALYDEGSSIWSVNN